MTLFTIFLDSPGRGTMLEVECANIAVAWDIGKAKALQMGLLDARVSVSQVMDEQVQK